MEKPWITIREFREMFGFHTDATAYKLIQQGKIKAVHRCGRYWISWESILGYMKPSDKPMVVGGKVVQSGKEIK